MSLPDESTATNASSPARDSEMDALLLGRIKELPSVDIKTSNWKGTLISILVIFLLCSVIIFAIYIINPDIQYKLSRNLNKEKLKLSDFLNGKYTVSSTLNSTWISDTEITFTDVDGSFVLYNVESNTKQTIVYGNVMKQYEVSRAILSPDRKYVLFISNYKNVFRYSSLAHYKIFNISSPLDVITIKPAEANEDARLQAAQWAPTESHLAFVFSNNLYYMPPGLTETIRITNEENKYIYSGIPDWIYEEEILAVASALWWSDDGKMLAFGQFNDTQVDTQEYPWYGDTVDGNSQYLDRVKIKYPKPGHNNPTIKLFVVNLVNDYQPKEVLPPANLTNSDYYLTSVDWASHDTLIAVWLTREQTYSSLSVCSPVNNLNWQCRDNFIKESKEGWVEINKVFVGPDKENYYTLHRDSSKFQNMQIVKINIKTSNIQYLTSGHRDITNILKVDRSKTTNGAVVYFTSTREGKPGERHVYSLEDVGNQRMTMPHYYDKFHYGSAVQRKQAKPTAVEQLPESNTECYTCDKIELNQCLYNRVSFSQNGTYYFRECLGPDYPYSSLHRIDNQTYSLPWMDNDNLKATLANKLLPTVKTELINKTDYALIVQMFMPPTYDKDQIVKYPLLIQVYGGPGSQNVNEHFKMNFGKYLTSSKEIIYAFIDGRGSGYQGETMKHYLYHKLGSAEIEDQIFVAKYLRDKYRFINKDAIGIWGWSYGGYATALILAKDSIDPVFSCGISVAPVTSWLLYDSAYTERYMGLPKDNLQNYIQSDVMHLANNFKGKKYLLIHGTADDNVHVQNSMALIKALNHANVMFQTQIYPDENHGLGGVSLHLYNRMENFWNDCFQMNSYVEEIGMRRRRIVKKDSI